MNTGTELHPFEIHIPDEAIRRLQDRLADTRFPERETVDDWSQGIPLDYTKHLCAVWGKEYDWRRVESELNARDQWITRIDGLDVHFLHVRSARHDARPLLVTHGWPGSVIEALDVIDGLVDPPADQPAFHLVLPSLPGYGFSGKPARPGWNLTRIADAWAELMARLGYDRFLAQGGDWGAQVTTTLALRHPDRVAMMHTTVPWAPRPDGVTDDELTDVERQWLAERAEFVRTGLGYAIEQSTRPQTLGYALTDSPVGQLAWIAEKYFEFTDHDGTPESAVPLNRVLDTVSLYWFTATGTSSARMYWESHGAIDMVTPVTVPTGVSVFPRDLMKLPRAWTAARYRDLRHWRALPRGGHFAMLEVPDVFVDEVRTCFAGAPR
ncbi:epoxide hydrolase family protein [Amycolatopsis pithecellobii]|uniref:Alpha/beta fold hydrolase n=1 Tax=Amycolatopsis pithecellobii TaxID=664692 RepID=A0A6N7Z3J4_9PSEU|nr:epoxide hydrolase family protein [Amycolatopsis pithecellobii]MTD54634.1 alpha/beta fold hydrolase [Amycolatopsis pithecellobii]